MVNRTAVLFRSPQVRSSTFVDGFSMATGWSTSPMLPGLANVYRRWQTASCWEFVLLGVSCWELILSAISLQA